MKYAILGGAFDPLHSEHMALIEGIINSKLCDKIILVPSYNPPHKSKKLVSFEHRITMLTLYCGKNSNIIIDTIERDMGLDDSYAYKIIPKIKEKYGINEYFYAIGGDSMIMFHKWVEPQKIADEVTLIVAGRKGYIGVEEAIENEKNNFNAKIVLLNCELREFSSTELKGRLELDYNLDDFILHEIASYISAHNLYKNYTNIVKYVQSKLSERTYNHSVRTAIFALKYANLLGLSYEKVLLASLLHDVAKCTIFNEYEYKHTHNRVKHQYHAKYLIETELNSTDADILDAVEFHTTGKPNMSTLGKLVYVADKLEEHRNYPSVDILRQTVDEDFEAGFKLVVKNQLEFLKKSAQAIDDLTLQCAIWYNIVEI